MLNVVDQRILVLSPHTDDGEFGCGASIAKWSKSNEVHYVAFSSCEASVPDGFPKDVLRTECAEATQILGIDHSRFSVLNYPVRYFPKHRQDILEDLIRLKKSIQPDLVLMPSLSDVHQDHQTIANEGLRAFKHSTILSYELPWNSIEFKQTCFVGLSEEDLQTKIESVAAYRSQGFRIYSGADFIKAQATMRGVQSNHKYAEIFEVVRLHLH